MKRFAALVVATALLVAGCGGSSGSGDTAGYVDSGTGITVLPAADREPGPVLSGETIDGGELTTADWAGQVVVVNVWGPWCAPCRKEMPVLKEVSEQYADQGVQFVGVVNRAKSDTSQAFAEKVGIEYPSFADQGGKLELKFNDSLPTVGIPTTWIIDAEGRVAVRIAINDLTAATLAGLIDDVKASTA